MVPKKMQMCQKEGFPTIKLKDSGKGLPYYALNMDNKKHIQLPFWCNKKISWRALSPKLTPQIATVYSVHQQSIDLNLIKVQLKTKTQLRVFSLSSFLLFIFRF